MEEISISETDPETIAGRYKRTIRWEEAIDSTEKNYGIQEGLIAALIMQESCGDPLKTEKTGDGGAGLMMFQPGTASWMGLKVYGKSKATGIDHEHGKQLKNLKNKYKNNLEKLAELDERFDIGKSIDVGAKYLKRLYNQYHTWTKAIYSYNKGSCKVSNNEAMKYRLNQAVRLFQEVWFEEKLLHGQDVDENLLEELRSLNSFDGELLKTSGGQDSLTKDGKVIFKYIKKPADYSKDFVAKKFEVWDNYVNGDKYEIVSYSRDIRSNPQIEGMSQNKFSNTKVIYLTAKKKSTGN